jgi:hypothetical protein
VVSWLSHLKNWDVAVATKVPVTLVHRVQQCMTVAAAKACLQPQNNSYNNEHKQAFPLQCITFLSSSRKTGGDARLMVGVRLFCKAKPTGHNWPT